mmetsp:Transcript_26055/g.38192  ORF Transcript_26055/g.38192 Transcript_26055/m.38192 type:complete len:90 (+) Transcript_26055:2612-2881(+)
MKAVLNRRGPPFLGLRFLTFSPSSEERLPLSSFPFDADSEAADFTRRFDFFDVCIVAGGTREYLFCFSNGASQPIRSANLHGFRLGSGS